MADAVRLADVLVLIGMAGLTQARPAAPPQADGQAALAADAAAAQGGVKTLGEVRAVIGEGEPVDLYKYRNPYASAPNRFDKGYKPPPSPEQISQGGGYVMHGLYGLIGLAAKGLQSLPGVKGPIQSAAARPPPQLGDDQVRRAAACSRQEACAAPAAAGQ